MLIYLDNDFKCHLTNDGTMREYDDKGFFEGRCPAFIEGYRVVPEGETWVREDGEPFSGTMVAPWRDYRLLEEFQEQYENQEAEHLEEIGALVEEIYENDLGVIENV